MSATESDIETLRIHTEASSSEHTFFLAVGIVPANFCSACWWASFQRAVLQLDFSPFLSVFFFSLAVLSVVLLSCIILFALAWHLYSLHCSQWGCAPVCA